MSEKAEERGPFTFSYTYFIALYFVMIFVGLFPSVIIGYWYFSFFPFSFDPLYLLFLIPLFFVLYGIALLSTLLSVRIGIWIVHKRVARPKPGSYPLTMEDPNTRAFVLKGNIKNFGRWLFYFFHLKFLRAFWMRQMGVKIGKNVKWGFYLQDEDFIEIGDNTFMAWNSIVSGHLMDQTHITLNPTIIGKNCIFDHHSGSVGGTIGGNSIFKEYTGVMKGQICRGTAIYEGIPCKKVGEYSDLTPDDIEKLKQKIRNYNKINHIKEKNTPIKINNTKLFLMKLTVVIGGCLFGLFIPFLHSLLFRAAYIPTNHLLNISVLMLIPPLFLVSMAFFICGIVVFIKLFLSYYNRKGEIQEGTYELDDPLAKTFKIKYLLKMFGLRLFHNTPFKITDTFAMRVWGNVKLGKFVKIEDAIVDPQYLEVGDFSQIAAGARIHTHDIVNGKLFIKKVIIGKKVLIGTYAHLKPGVEIADGSVLAVMAWFRKNRKCKRPALWLGKPAFELPLSVLTKSARLEGKYVD